MIRMNVFNIRIHKNVQIKFNSVLCCFKNQCLLTLSNFSYWRRRIKNVFLAKKRNWQNFDIIKYKEEYDIEEYEVVNELWFVFSVMLNHHCTINISCTFINFENVTPILRLFYTARLLILAVIPLRYDLKVLYDYSVLKRYLKR